MFSWRAVCCPNVCSQHVTACTFYRHFSLLPFPAVRTMTANFDSHESLSLQLMVFLLNILGILLFSHLKILDPIKCEWIFRILFHWLNYAMSFRNCESLWLIALAISGMIVNLTLNIKSIWFKYFPITRNLGSNFSSAIVTQLFKSNWLHFFFQCNIAIAFLDISYQLYNFGNSIRVV